ncbi:TIGR02266 family protein [Pyxidicoccus sp. MSG2]|uniref:TIGR02266 family protein n=1 Tax=Pyxidicoccus sp. MSG2 TaxID=2996790 RepID=UPI00226F8AD9|nr:TIGR02266 family protein [Pyxidicoccus sp. MSG2]MCY1016922.1 TIGR02266 family protein [Pyxidicoccus sp. MSG2]
MPVFGLAALWNGSALPERVAAWVEGLGTLLSTAQSLQLVVSLRAEEAGLELKVEAPGYPRAAVEKLAEEAKRSRGTFVELWRMPKAERDAFRTATFGGGTPYPGEERAAAARALQQHVSKLAASGERPSVPPANPMDAPRPVQAPRPGPEAPPARAAASLPEGGAATAAASMPEPSAPQPRAIAPSHRVPTAPRDSPQRRGRRFAVKLELEFRTELDFVREHALNISNGGLFVRTAHRPQPDSVVTVDVKLPNGNRLQGDAVVVHVVDDPYTGGVGLAFLNDDATFSQTLDEYLASLVGGTG